MKQPVTCRKCGSKMVLISEAILDLNASSNKISPTTSVPPDEVGFVRRIYKCQNHKCGHEVDAMPREA